VRLLGRSGAFLRGQELDAVDGDGGAEERHVVGALAGELEHRRRPSPLLAQLLQPRLVHFRVIRRSPSGLIRARRQLRRGMENRSGGDWDSTHACSVCASRGARPPRFCFDGVSSARFLPFGVVWLVC
jgi:hypothetical protein